MLATECQQIWGSEERGVFGLSAGGPVTFLHPDTDYGYEQTVLEMEEYFDEVMARDD